MAGDSHSNGTHQQQLMYKSYRIPSDMDSQISLPRSYTLPREFKYYRRPKSRKAIRSEHFVASTNSSDGKQGFVFLYFYHISGKIKYFTLLSHFSLHEKSQSGNLSAEVSYCLRVRFRTIVSILDSRS